MKTKLKLYSILLLLALGVSIGLNLNFHLPDMVQGFKDGWEAGRSGADAMWDGTAVQEHSPMVTFVIELFSGIAAIAAVILIVAFFYVFFSTIINIRKGKIFEPFIASKFKFMGRLLILYFAIYLLDGVLNHPWSEMDLPTTYLYIGCAMLIVSDVLGKMREMKDEQDLTV